MRGPFRCVKNVPYSERWNDAQKISPVTPSTEPNTAVARVQVPKRAY